MFKKVMAAAALSLLAAGASAAPVNYVLSTVTYENTFTGSTPYTVGIELAGTCTGCGVSTAQDDGFGNITVNDAAWAVNAFGNNYNVSFDAAGIVALGTSLTKTNIVCNNIAGGFCLPASIKSGYAFGTDYTGVGGNGTTACLYCVVDIWQTANTLHVEIGKNLSESNGPVFFQKYSLNYSVVPVPAAVWFFGSALGLLGLARRKVIAA